MQIAWPSTCRGTCFAFFSGGSPSSGFPTTWEKVTGVTPSSPMHPWERDCPEPSKPAKHTPQYVSRPSRCSKI